MFDGKFGITEILLLMVLALLVFGAKRLPEIGASMGKGIREFKRSLSETQSALMSPPDDQRSVPPPRILEEEPNRQSAAAPTGGEPKRLSQ
jgi:sec-independent protein translocase protein TatA